VDDIALDHGRGHALAFGNLASEQRLGSSSRYLGRPIRARLLGDYAGKDVCCSRIPAVFRQVDGVEVTFHHESIEVFQQ